jgi:hypothetical protein
LGSFASNRQVEENHNPIASGEAMLDAGYWMLDEYFPIILGNIMDPFYIPYATN